MGDWAEAVAAAAQLGTLLVIGGSVIAALVQLRHVQAGNQLQALLSLERDFHAPDLQAALTYVQEHLPERLEDPGVSPRARTPRVRRSGRASRNDRLQLA